MVTSTRMKLVPNASTSTNSILASYKIALLPSLQQHWTQLQSWLTSTLRCYLQSSSTKPSCNPDQLQHYLATFNLAVSSPAINNLMLSYLQRSSIKAITRACLCSTSPWTWRAKCWRLFFRPTWHYFIGNPCHINILLIFWVNLFKTQNKLISHSTTWIGLTWPTTLSTSTYGLG